MTGADGKFTNLAGAGNELVCATNDGLAQLCYDGTNFNFPAHGIAYLVNSTDGCGSLPNCTTMSTDCTGNSASGTTNFDCGKNVAISHNSADCTVTFLAQYGITGVGTSPASLGWIVVPAINGTTAEVHFINTTGANFPNSTGHGLAARIHLPSLMPKLSKWLGKLVDPRGPIGEIASADVFKQRAGLPIDTPHSARPFPTTAQVEKALAPAPFVPLEEGKSGPRVRVVSAFVEEEWTPVYATAQKSRSLLEIFSTAQRQVGWKVVQRARAPHCGLHDGAVHQARR